MDRTAVLLITAALLIQLLQVNSSASESGNGLLNGMRAECANDGIKVHLEFRKPFYGVAYSHGYYETERCRYIEQDSPDAGSTNYSFLIPAKGCGTVEHGTTPPAASSATTTFSEQIRDGRALLLPSSSPQSHDTVRAVMGAYGPQSEGNQYTSERKRRSSNSNEIYIENTLLIQNDPSIQEAGDLAQTLRCVWHKEIHRPLVASLPFHTAPRTRRPVEMAPTSVPRYQHRFGSIYGGMGGIRMEHKGQVESVPHYPGFGNSRRQQWSRSLKESTEDAEDSSGHPDRSRDYKMALALPLTVGNGASAVATALAGTTAALAALALFAL